MCRLFLQGIYKKNDMDNSGTMSTPEMRMALKEAGESLGIFWSCDYFFIEPIFLASLEISLIWHIWIGESVHG